MQERNSDLSVVESVIRKRVTEKVTCDVEDHQRVPLELAEQNRSKVLRAIETAGWAPFHYPRNIGGIAEPWRAHILWDDQVKLVAEHMRSELKVTSKEPKLAAACNVLILVTWLPQFYHLEERTESQVSIDEEHLAATSAMVQNLLLILTADGMGTYWGSGGKFRHAELFRFLAIPERERLLAAIHVEYPEMRSGDKDRKPGKHRESRCGRWIREVNLGG